MKIEIPNSTPDGLKFVADFIESAAEVGLRVGLISGEDAEKFFSRNNYKEDDIKSLPCTNEVRVTREMSEKDDILAAAIAPFVGDIFLNGLPYKGVIDLSKYPERTVIAAVFAMTRLLENPEAKEFVLPLNEGDCDIDVGFFVDINRAYGEIEGSFVAHDFQELADAVFEIFLEFKKENAEITFNFCLVEKD